MLSLFELPLATCVHRSLDYQPLYLVMNPRVMHRFLNLFLTLTVVLYMTG